MNNRELLCSQCGFLLKEKQHFCGGCGQKLRNVCPSCDTANPATYRFCGQCGKDLRILTTIILDRAGLIVEVENATDLISQTAAESLLGKPFSIFVDISDRAFFFSCWNVVLNSSKQKDLEVVFKPDQDRVINTNLFLTPQHTSGGTVESIQIKVEDVTDRKESQQQRVEQDSLLKLIGSLTEICHPSKRKSRQKSINGVLEKIGQASEAQSAFVSRIDVVSQLLFTEFKWQDSVVPGKYKSTNTIPLETINSVLKTLQKGIPYTVEDFSLLSPSECQLWEKWHPGLSFGSLACEIICRDYKPVGIIGIIREKQGVWPQDSVMLLKLAAQLISETLPKSMSGSSLLQPPDVSISEYEAKETIQQSQDFSELEDIETIADAYESIETIGEGYERMMMTPVVEGNPENAHPVFAADDGVYVLQCPECKQSDVVEEDCFNISGWLLDVTCPCGCSFRVIREMRKAYRKDVQLPGSFNCSSGELNRLDRDGKWVSMEVTNISKRGLNFKGPMTQLLRVGDNIPLRFNLDNSTNSLIKKSAIIKSVRKNNVSCQFQNSDQYDTTLGFYFL